jgi:HD superfamily phosphohydrolase
MKKIVSLALIISTLLCALTLASCGSNKKEEEFYNLVDETKELLDVVADDIYSYWYDCIYEDKYRENITYAVACAKSDNEENINTIEENTTKIKDLYKEIKDRKLGSEAKAVMQAYNDYYTLIVEVSGSFKSFSASKETCKKELASAIDDFSFELE